MNHELNRKTLDLTYTALCTAFLAIGAFIKIPSSPIPFTLQTFFVYFALFFIGPKKSLVSIAVYLTLGALGLPVFSGFAGGLHVLFGATGGYLFGFLLIPVVFMVIKTTSFYQKVLACLLSLAICYLFGSLWYAFLYLDGASSLSGVLLGCVVPFIIPDFIKISLAWLISDRLLRLTRQK